MFVPVFVIAVVLVWDAMKIHDSWLVVAVALDCNYRDNHRQVLPSSSGLHSHVLDHHSKQIR